MIVVESEEAMKQNNDIILVEDIHFDEEEMDYSDFEELIVDDMTRRISYGDKIFKGELLKKIEETLRLRNLVRDCMKVFFNEPNSKKEARLKAEIELTELQEDVVVETGVCLLTYLKDIERMKNESLAQSPKIGLVYRMSKNSTKMFFKASNVAKYSSGNLREFKKALKRKRNIALHLC
ncbi:hypothetical protein L6452_08830 [Arctium lappa]|uniref:Uncharacterized protein n=1 Tax=Arctium lappa TaxID=4217 RepID=A0ACB9DIT5_ARCLA|nr:hypothetical protein L6452_08830 [Arctium lappa]